MPVAFFFFPEKRKCLKYEILGEFMECVHRLRLVGKTRRLIKKNVFKNGPLLSHVLPTKTGFSIRLRFLNFWRLVFCLPFFLPIILFLKRFFFSFLIAHALCFSLTEVEKKKKKNNFLDSRQRSSFTVHETLPAKSSECRLF